MGSKKKVAKEKPLEKMTATELRELAKSIPEIVGAHGMNKTELVSAVKQARGIQETVIKKADVTVRQIKEKIKAFKTKRTEALAADDAKMAGIYRRRISKLKKKTRRAA